MAIVACAVAVACSGSRGPVEDALPSDDGGRPAESDVDAVADGDGPPEPCSGCACCFSGQQCVEERCTGVGALSPEELLRALRAKDFLLINVRVPPVGIIPGTDSSISNEEPDRLAEAIGPDRHERVVLYCRTNPRSLDAVDQLTSRGYVNVSYLRGGVEAWLEAGYELE